MFSVVADMPTIEAHVAYLNNICNRWTHLSADHVHQVVLVCHNPYRLGTHQVAISRYDQLSFQSRLASPALTVEVRCCLDLRYHLLEYSFNTARAIGFVIVLLNYIGSPKARADKYIQRADSQWTEKQRVIGAWGSLWHQPPIRVSFTSLISYFSYLFIGR